ncbi:MAG: hypothetical protein ABL881_09985 [Novosphingobium sp.]
MDMGTALVVIAGIGAFYSLKSQRIGAGGGFGRKHRRGGEAPADPQTLLASPREAELQKEVEGLRERIHVLERIATDGRGTRALADEIEGLREK